MGTVRSRHPGQLRDLGEPPGRVFILVITDDGLISLRNVTDDCGTSN